MMLFSTGTMRFDSGASRLMIWLINVDRAAPLCIQTHILCLRGKKTKPSFTSEWQWVVPSSLGFIKLCVHTKTLAVDEATIGQSLLCSLPCLSAKNLWLYNGLIWHSHHLKGKHIAPSELGITRWTSVEDDSVQIRWMQVRPLDLFCFCVDKLCKQSKECCLVK